MVWSKKAEKIFMILKCTFCGLFIFLLVVFCAYSETHYSRTGWIQPTGVKNEFEFIDITGNIWAFTDDNLIIPNGKTIEAVVKMHTNNTINRIEDDIILNYKFKN